MNLTWWKYNLGALLLLVMGCHKAPELMDSFNKIAQNKITNETKYIVELGIKDCPKCTKKMADFIAQLEEDSTTITIVNFNPNHLDIEELLQKENVYLDSFQILKNELKENNIKIFELKNKIIIKEQEVNLKNIDSIIQAF